MYVQYDAGCVLVRDRKLHEKAFATRPDYLQHSDRRVAAGENGLMVTSPAPATQHLPMPRVTTAACEVMPPREVRMPAATSMPAISSGVVSPRTRMMILVGAVADGTSPRLRR